MTVEKDVYCLQPNLNIKANLRKGFLRALAPFQYKYIYFKNFHHITEANNKKKNKNYILGFTINKSQSANLTG